MYLLVFFDYGCLIIFLLIGMPIYLVTRQLVKRVAINKIPKKITALALTIILTTVISFAIIRTYYSMFKEEAGVAFNEQQWYGHPQKRYLMADSIVASNMLIGKDTSYIKQFFNDNRVFREGFISPDQQHIRTYDLGMDPSGLGGMFHYLVVDFRNDTVASVRHMKVQD